MFRIDKRLNEKVKKLNGIHEIATYQINYDDQSIDILYI